MLRMIYHDFFSVSVKCESYLSTTKKGGLWESTKVDYDSSVASVESETTTQQTALASIIVNKPLKTHSNYP